VATHRGGAVRRTLREPRRGLPRLAALLLACAACEFGETRIGAGRARPVVHAVLNPEASSDTYVIYVERTLTGELDTRSVRDTADPIASGGGMPVSQARVELWNEAGGPTAVGVEDASIREDGKGRGVYRFLDQACSPLGCAPNALPVTRGARYRLRVTLPGGDVVESETTVPVPTLAPDSLPTTQFDRERDTLRLTWPAAERAHRYVLQVQTPYGPFQVFSDTNAITLTGGLRNLDVDRLPLVFTPGFRQSVQIAAVDTNFYDYYRSVSDPFTGAGLISRMRGGLGLFGAYAPIRRSSFEVTAPQDEPVEGSFVRGTERFTLYATGPGLVSGRYFANSVRLGVLGTRDGNRMRLTVLLTSRISDTLFVADAEVVGDTLTVRRSREEGQRYFRQR
jgi:hypothetical protein